MLKIPAELKVLSKIFAEHGKSLYIVGGFVRDSYLGLSSLLRDDIDICSNVKPKELVKMLDGSDFNVSPINEKLGVMEILGKRRYEYATFRREIYEDESHIPDSVEFINSLEEDARRRDFKINAIYYDIEKSEYIDPVGGIADLREKQITTVKVPKIVFNDDPERILRFIRFACSLGFDIPEEEFYYAKQNSYKIQFISKTRLRNEFERLLTSDQVYPNLLYTKDAHFRAMILLGELDVWKYILPAVDHIMHSNLTDKKGERIYDHILNSLKNASPKIRLAVLLHDAAKVRTMEKEHNFFGSKEFVPVIVDTNLGPYGLGYSKDVISRVTRTILGYDYNNHCMATKNAVKKFILKNYDIIENIIEIKAVVKNESKPVIKKVRSGDILRKTYNEMLKEHAPFDRRDLNIRGDDIIKNMPNIKLENIDTLIENILERVALDPKKNNKEDLLLVMHKVVNSNRDYYLD